MSDHFFFVDFKPDIGEKSIKPDTREKSNLSLGAILGTVGTCVVIVLTLILLLLFFIRKNAKNNGKIIKLGFLDCSLKVFHQNYCRPFIFQ